MQQQKISEAEFHMLRNPQQGRIKPGDLVYTTWFELSQVVASPGPDGDTAVRGADGNIRLWQPTNLRLAPLFWLEGKPVYPGDTLYWSTASWYGTLNVSEYSDEAVTGLTKTGSILAGVAALSWNEVRRLEDQLLRIGDTVYKKGDATPLTVHSFNGDCVYTSPNDWINLKTLTREKPEVETLVEGQPVVEGETLFHKSIDVQGVVMRWCNNTVGLDTGQDVIGFSTQVLTRTDPSILFYVEGKPVRKGDKLYSTYNRQSSLVNCERIISGKSRCPGNYAVGDDDNFGEIQFLTWEPPLCQVEGKLVFKGDNLYSTVCHSYGDLREIVGVHDSGVYSTPDCTYKGEISTLTWDAPEIKLPTGWIVYHGTKVWHRETGECWEVVSYNEQWGTLFVRQGYSTFTNLKPSSVKVSAPLFKLEGKPVFEGDKVWTLSGDKVIVKDLEHGKVITSPSDWNCCTVFTQDWLSLTPIKRIIVDCEAVEQGEVLYFLDSGEEFKVLRQVRDRLEDCSGRSVDPSQLTRNDPTLVEVPIWVNFNDDGTSAVMFNSPGVTRCVYFQAKGTLPLPKHIADKLKR